MKLPDLARSFDLRSPPPGFTENPYPFYDVLRCSDPIHRCPDGSLLLTRWRDCAATYHDTHAYSSDKHVEFKPRFGDGPLYLHHTTSLVFNDPPLHTRVRKLLAPAFTPRSLALLEARFVAQVDRLLDRAATTGGMDLIADYASALPVAIAGDMLGIPAEIRPHLREWSLAILGALEPALTAEQREGGERAVVAFSAFLERHIAAFRAGRLGSDADVLALLVDREIDGERLSDKELIQNCIFLLNAGHETTTNLIGNGVAALLDHPEERERLAREPSLIDSAVEEFLRFDSSNQLGNRRVVQPVELAGARLDPGQLVTLCIGAANRDPEQFPDPNRLNIGRQPNRHLAFATGPHMCLGATLARLEGRIAIARLLHRFPGLRCAGEPVRGGRIRFRGFLSYPISW